MEVNLLFYFLKMSFTVVSPKYNKYSELLLPDDIIVWISAPFFIFKTADKYARPAVKRKRAMVAEFIIIKYCFRKP